MSRPVSRPVTTRFAPSPTGFIHIGTARQDAPERERPDPRDLLTDWRP